MNKSQTALLVTAFVLGVLDLVLIVMLTMNVTHKSFAELVGLSHPKPAAVQKVVPTATPVLVSVTATPSGTLLHSKYKLEVSPSVSPVPSHVILKK